MLREYFLKSSLVAHLDVMTLFNLRIIITTLKKVTFKYKIIFYFRLLQYVYSFDKERFEMKIKFGVILLGLCFIFVRNSKCAVIKEKSNLSLQEEIERQLEKSRLLEEFRNEDGRRLSGNIGIDDLLSENSLQGGNPNAKQFGFNRLSAFQFLKLHNLKFLTLAALIKLIAAKALPKKFIGKHLKRVESIFLKNNFLGRCFGVARKLKVAIPLIVFKLGVIVTTLGFLTLFTIKGVGISLLILFLHLAKIVGKISFLKGGFFGSEYFSHHGHHGHGDQGSGIHYHIHGKAGSSSYSAGHSHGHSEEEYGSPYSFYDRMSDALSKAKTPEERQELMQLYNNVMSGRSNQMGYSTIQQYR